MSATEPDPPRVVPVHDIALFKQTPKPGASITGEAAGGGAAPIVAAEGFTVEMTKEWPAELRELALAGRLPQPRPGQKDTSRSGWVWQFCREAIGAPIADELILAALLHRAFGISESIYDGRGAGDALKYAKRQIERVHDAIAARVDPNTLILSRDDWPETARCFMEHHRPKLLRYNDDWLSYDGAAYVEVEDAVIRAEVQPFLEAAVVIKKTEQETEQLPFRPNNQKIAEVEGALKRVTQRARDEFEPPCWLAGEGPHAREIVALRNGLLHLPTGELMAPTERFFTRNGLPFDFDADAPPPARWLEFLGQVWPGGEAEIATLQEIFGYVLTPDTSQQKMFLLVGPRRSGKGTIGRVLTRLVGQPNACAPSLRSLETNFGLQPLIGKQLAVIADMRIDKNTNQAALAENFLGISGEDNFTVDRKYKEAWTGKIGVRFLILSNDLPEFHDPSGALASRFVPLMMRESFLGREDTGLLDKLLPELPGILNWSLAGWRRLRERGRFAPPESSRRAIQKMEGMGSPVKAFLRERCVLGPATSVEKAALFAAWRGWCDERDVGCGTMDTFGRNLVTASGHRVESRKGPRGEGRRPIYRGVGLIGEAPEQDEIPF